MEKVENGGRLGPTDPLDPPIFGGVYQEGGGGGQTYDGRAGGAAIISGADRNQRRTIGEIRLP